MISVPIVILATLLPTIMVFVDRIQGDTKVISRATISSTAFNKLQKSKESRMNLQPYYENFMNSVTEEKGITCGNFHCICFESNRSAICFNQTRTMTYIPRFPSYVTTLKIKENTALSFSRTMFTNLTNLNLKNLLFCNCYIRNIPEDTFSGLKSLQKLVISGSRKLAPLELMLSFKNVSKDIKTLFLDSNGWYNLPENMFQFLKGSNVTKLNLNSNRLESFNGSILLKNIHRLMELRIGNNPLYFDKLDLGNMDYVQILDLRSNFLMGKIPDFCVTKPENISKSKLPYLQRLFLTEISLKEVNRNALKCLQNLQSLYLDGNLLNHLPNGWFAHLHQLRYISLNNLFRLKYLRPRAFQSQSLKSLFFQSKFDFTGKAQKSNYTKIFSYCPNLENLNIDGNRIASGSLFKSLIAPLTRLKKLSAVAVYLFDLQEGTFDHMHQLKKLSLGGNNLRSWPDSLFSKVLNLQKLYLDGNAISVVKQSMLPDSFLHNLRYIHLGNNPYFCACELIWFRDWTRKNTKILGPYPRKYKCQSPENLNGKLLSDFNVTADEICKEPNVWDLLEIILPVSACSSLLVIFVIYHQMPLIRNFVYLIRLRQSGYVKLINEEEEYMFSAFFVFSEKDSKWVIKYLLPIVEGGGLRACVPGRDFVVGDSFSDQLGENITNSRKLVVVLTNNFANDEWCQWQLQLVQEKVRQLGKACVVVILLKEIDTKHMTSSIRQMMRMHPYVTWASGSLRQRLFNKVVLRALQEPLGNPPTAIPSYGSISS